MSPQQAENLRILIRHMETNVTRTLDMGSVMHSCGTPACAIGEATQIKQFGLSGEGPYSLSLNGTSIGLTGASQVVFGVENGGRLFGGSLHGEVFVSPKTWAIEARKVLTEHGYTMNANGFDRFMAKVREPVSLMPETTAR